MLKHLHYLYLLIPLILFECTAQVKEDNHSTTRKIDFHTADLDGDGRTDIIDFDYSGGAHCCYTIRITLTSTRITTKYPFEIEGGYPEGRVDTSEPWKLNIKDYDGDGLPEIFTKIYTYNDQTAPIPKNIAQKYNLHHNNVYFEYENGNLRFEDFPDYISTEQYFQSKKIDTVPEELFPYYKNGYYGFRDKNNRVIVLNQLKKVNSYTNGRAVVTTTKGDECIINGRGQIIGCPHPGESWFFPEAQYSREGLIHLFIAEKEEHLFLDKNGKNAFGRSFPDAHQFTEGLASVKERNTGKYGFINAQGEWIIQPQFETAQPFERGKAFVRRDGKFFYIDHKGHRIMDSPVSSKNG